MRHAELLAMLANCHRLAMDKFDRKGNRHPGAHPQPWEADEFLPAEFRIGRAIREKQIIHGSIECLKMFVPKGSTPTTLDRRTFTVTQEE